MRSMIQPSTLQAMLQRVHAPETHLPVNKILPTHHKSFLMLVAMVAALGMAPVVVAYMAAAMLR